jgi:glycosyltransferase involved in cell wall biosynthesis
MTAVSVVVPTCNRVDVLALTVHSILAQRDVELELIVIDEASTDDTPGYLASLGDRVRVVRHDTRVGAAGARNAGLALADAHYVAFCDDDDLWAPTKLAAQLRALAAGTARWCAVGSVMINNEFRMVDHQRPPPAGDVLLPLLRHNGIPGGGSGVLAETALVREAGGFWDELRNAEDWELWIRLAARARVAVVDVPLVAYRIWPGSKSRDANRMDAAHRAIRDRHAAAADSLGVTADEVAIGRHLAKQHLRNGERVAAARRFLELGRHSRRVHLVRAAMALTAPATMDRIGSGRAQRAIPPEWRAAAESWLIDLVDEGSRAGIPIGH